MFSNNFIVIHFGSMVVGYTKAVGNWFMKESGVDFFGWCGILFVNLLTGVLNRANKLKLLSCRPIVTC